MDSPNNPFDLLDQPVGQVVAIALVGATLDGAEVAGLADHR
jgi:hypothetical protein